MPTLGPRPTVSSNPTHAHDELARAAAQLPLHERFATTVQGTAQDAADDASAALRAAREAAGPHAAYTDDRMRNAEHCLARGDRATAEARENVMALTTTLNALEGVIARESNDLFTTPRAEVRPERYVDLRTSRQLRDHLHTAVVGANTALGRASDRLKTAYELLMPDPANDDPWEEEHLDVGYGFPSVPSNTWAPNRSLRMHLNRGGDVQARVAASTLVEEAAHGHRALEHFGREAPRYAARVALEQLRAEEQLAPEPQRRRNAGDRSAALRRNAQGLPEAAARRQRDFVEQARARTASSEAASQASNAPTYGHVTSLRHEGIQAFRGAYEGLGALEAYDATLAMLSGLARAEHATTTEEADAARRATLERVTSLSSDLLAARGTLQNQLEATHDMVDQGHFDQYDDLLDGEAVRRASQAAARRERNREGNARSRQARDEARQPTRTVTVTTVTTTVTRLPPRDAHERSRYR